MQDLAIDTSPTQPPYRISQERDREGLEDGGYSSGKIEKI
jgi:hypothetical protein